MRTSLVYSTFVHFLVILAFITRQPAMYAILVLAGIYAIARNAKAFTELSKKEFYSIIVYVIVISLMTTINIFEEIVVGFHFFIGIFTLVLAVIFTRDPRVYYYSSKVSLIVFQIVILFFVYIKGFENFPREVPLEKIIEDSSANGITSYMVMLQVNYSIASYLLYRRVPLVTTFITMVIAMIGYGRGSIFSSFLIIGISLFTKYAQKGAVVLIRSAIVLALVLVIVFLRYSEDIFLFFEANTKISAAFVDDQRKFIIDDYIGKIDIVSFFLGADYTGTSILTHFKGNPHNALIRAHHIFGIPYLLFVTIFPLYCIFQRKGMLEVFFYFSLILILFFRVFSEPVIFPTIFDFYYFSMCLMILRNSALFSKGKTI